ncbi:MAG: FAD-binding protein [Actinomycetota bacterium]
MSDLAELSTSLEGELFSPDSPGYDAVCAPENAAFRDARPQLVVLCRSVSDVVRSIAYANATGTHLVPRGGGHCFAGRSTTDGIVLDLSGVRGISVNEDGAAVIGAGARLAEVYTALHAHGRTLPAGCGPTVGIAGLTLGGGIGLLGRKHGLTCDQLIEAQVVLADGRVVVCDENRDSQLFWALRGAGGGQFGVVTSLTFETVDEPTVTRIEAQWPADGVEELVSAWQAWAPDAPDDMTVDLALESVPGEAAVLARLTGASSLSQGATRGLLRGFMGQAGVPAALELPGPIPFHSLKLDLAALGLTPNGRAMRLRSEFFEHSMTDGTVTTLVALLRDPAATSQRRLTFTAMGGAYNRVAEDATAFAHRRERFLLEHVADPVDPWIDASWATAHAWGSGRVYPNFPDPALDDGPAAYHAGNRARLAAVKRRYDPHRFFDFPQAV